MTVSDHSLALHVTRTHYSKHLSRDMILLHTSRDRPNALVYFFWKNVDIFDMPDILAFFSFSTPCEAFDFALRFFPSPSTTSVTRGFVTGAPASAIAISSSFSALTCASSRVKLQPNHMMSVKRTGVTHTYSYFATSAEYKSCVTYCETRLQAALMRPTARQ